MKINVQNIPQSSGVYLFKDKKDNVIYVGKAINLQKRVKSYVNGKDNKSLQIIKVAKNVEVVQTETAIEALIQEAELIKKYKPIYNVKDNDDRSFLYVAITKDVYPRVILIREKDIKKNIYQNIFGPFVFSSEIRSALRIIRKIFPFSTHTKKEIETGNPCFYYQIGLCPGTCIGKITRNDYMHNIKNIKLLLKGKKKRIIFLLEQEMKKKAKNLEFEKAEEIKRKINALKFIQDTSIIYKKNKYNVNIPRIEGYDISNTSGDLATGSMVVFAGNSLQKNEYRLFKIKTVKGPDDTKMIEEVLRRRLKRNWPLPQLIVVDGGKGQVSSAKKVLLKKGFNIKVVGIAKGKDRKKQDIIGDIPQGIEKDILLTVQREAHRFAIKYHRYLRSKKFLQK